MLQSRLLKISFVVAIFIFGPCACNPCGEVPNHFIVQSIKAENFSLSAGASQMQFVQAGTQVQWNDYILDVPFNVEYTAQVSGGGAALYATSCVEKGAGGANTGLKDVFVIALNDYNDSYHQDDTLNAIVSIGSSTDNMIPVSEFKVQNSPTLFAQKAVIKFLEAPAKDVDSYQFKVVVHLLNGDIFTATSDPVTLRN